MISGGVVGFSNVLLPGRGEDEMELAVEVFAPEGFPLSAIEPDLSGNGPFDVEVDSVSHLIADQDRS